MIPSLALSILPLLALPAMGAPVGLPMPMNHRRTLAPVNAQLEDRGLLSGLGLDLGVDLNVDLDTGLDLVLAPILDLDLGLKLDLEVETWLKCHTVNGVFGGREYDLGCTCLGAVGGLMLGIDIDINAVVNVAGLDAWVRAEVDLGLGFFYPAGAHPTCDGGGGWTCPTGHCGGASSSSRPATSFALSQSQFPPSSSATLPPASSVSSVVSTFSVAPSSVGVVSSALASSAAPTSVPASLSSSASVTSSYVSSSASIVSINDIPSSAASSSFISSTTSSIWSSPALSLASSSSSRSIVSTSSWTPVSSASPSASEPCDDEPISNNDTPASSSSYGGYTPSISAQSVSPSITGYAGGTTITLSTVFIVEHTQTITSTATSTATVTATTEKYIPGETVTVTQTITEGGECVTEEAIPSSSSWVAPSSSWIAPISSWTPPAPSWAASSSFAYSAPASTSSAAQISFPPILSEAPSASSTYPPPAQPSYIPPSPECGDGKKYDINLELCVDVCVGVLNAVGVCVDADVDLGLDLPPVVETVIGGLL